MSTLFKSKKALLKQYWRAHKAFKESVIRENDSQSEVDSFSTTSATGRRPSLDTLSSSAVGSVIDRRRSSVDVLLRSGSSTLHVKEFPGGIEQDESVISSHEPEGAVATGEQQCSPTTAATRGRKRKKLTRRRTAAIFYNHHQSSASETPTNELSGAPVVPSPVPSAAASGGAAPQRNCSQVATNQPLQSCANSIITQSVVESTSEDEIAKLKSQTVLMLNNSNIHHARQHHNHAHHAAHEHDALQRNEAADQSHSSNESNHSLIGINCLHARGLHKLGVNNCFNSLTNCVLEASSASSAQKRHSLATYNLDDDRLGPEHENQCSRNPTTMISHLQCDTAANSCHSNCGCCIAAQPTTSLDTSSGSTSAAPTQHALQQENQHLNFLNANCNFNCMECSSSTIRDTRSHASSVMAACELPISHAGGRSQYAENLASLLHHQNHGSGPALESGGPEAAYQGEQGVEEGALTRMQTAVQPNNRSNYGAAGQTTAATLCFNRRAQQAAALQHNLYDHNRHNRVFDQYQSASRVRHSIAWSGTGGEFHAPAKPPRSFTANRVTLSAIPQNYVPIQSVPNVDHHLSHPSSSASYYDLSACCCSCNPTSQTVVPPITSSPNIPLQVSSSFGTNLKSYSLPRSSLHGRQLKTSVSESQISAITKTTQVNHQPNSATSGSDNELNTTTRHPIKSRSRSRSKCKLSVVPICECLYRSPESGRSSACEGDHPVRSRASHGQVASQVSRETNESSSNLPAENRFSSKSNSSVHKSCSLPNLSDGALSVLSKSTSKSNKSKKMQPPKPARSVLPKESTTEVSAQNKEPQSLPSCETPKPKRPRGPSLILNHRRSGDRKPPPPLPPRPLSPANSSLTGPSSSVGSRSGSISMPAGSGGNYSSGAVTTLITRSRGRSISTILSPLAAFMANYGVQNVSAHYYTHPTSPSPPPTQVENYDLHETDDTLSSTTTNQQCSLREEENNDKKCQSAAAAQPADSSPAGEAVQDQPQPAPPIQTSQGERQSDCEFDSNPLITSSPASDRTQKLVRSISAGNNHHHKNLSDCDQLSDSQSSLDWGTPSRRTVTRVPTPVETPVSPTGRRMMMGTMAAHNSDEAISLGSSGCGSECFWEPGNYKKTTKRVDDGYRLCNDLCSLVQERADIEKGYAKALNTWSRKWTELIAKGPEYGTTEAAWRSMLAEADRRHDMHIRVRDQLIDNVISAVKLWQKNNYHKSMMHLKEKKDLDEQFRKAQKDWQKMLAKVNKCKIDYHSACKAERTALNQERNASGDTSLSPDQVKKLQDRVIKCKDEVRKTRDRYEAALQDLNEASPRYIEDMKIVFDKCQKQEAKRLDFFKKTLLSLHGCLNISADPELAQIYGDFQACIQNADAVHDLKWWSNTYGVDMPMHWPRFEEYCEEFRDITDKKRTAANVAKSDIILVNQHKYNDDLPQLAPPSATKQSSQSAATTPSSTLPPLSALTMGSTPKLTNGSLTAAQSRSGSTVNVSHQTMAISNGTKNGLNGHMNHDEQADVVPHNGHHHRHHGTSASSTTSSSNGSREGGRPNGHHNGHHHASRHGNGLGVPSSKISANDSGKGCDGSSASNTPFDDLCESDDWDDDRDDCCSTPPPPEHHPPPPTAQIQIERSHVVAAKSAHSSTNNIHTVTTSSGSQHHINHHTAVSKMDSTADSDDSSCVPVPPPPPPPPPPVQPPVSMPRTPSPPPPQPQVIESVPVDAVNNTTTVVIHSTNGDPADAATSPTIPHHPYHSPLVTKTSGSVSGSVVGGGCGAGSETTDTGTGTDGPPSPSPIVDDGRPGLPIRALYDYTAAEMDELSFKQGECFEKLEDEDDQGWCVGRKDGRVGLYPAHYVEPIKM